MREYAAVQCGQTREFMSSRHSICKKGEIFQRIVYVKFKFDRFVYQLDVMNFVYDKVIANQPIVEVL